MAQNFDKDVEIDIFCIYSMQIAALIQHKWNTPKGQA